MSDRSSSTDAAFASSRRAMQRQWVIACGAVLIGALLFAFGRGSWLGNGHSALYVVTVVPADARSLECASDQVFGPRRCGFDQKQQPVITDRPLRPFVTVGRELLLLSGVFESNSVAVWLSAAQQSGDSSRVTLECRATILGSAPQVFVRWAPNGEFSPEHGVTAANVEDCVVKR